MAEFEEDTFVFPDEKEAKVEIAHWFGEAELFDYETVHQKYTQTIK